MMKTLAHSTHTIALSLLLFAAAATACGSSEKAKATTPAGASDAASCSAEECASIPEPPIAPTACGPNHENEIGTTCERASGECRKVLTCGGQRPQ